MMEIMKKALDKLKKIAPSSIKCQGSSYIFIINKERNLAVLLPIHDAMH